MCLLCWNLHASTQLIKALSTTQSQPAYGFFELFEDLGRILVSENDFFLIAGLA
jgi:hypothetical protein